MSEQTQVVHTVEEPPTPIDFDPTPFLSDEMLDSLNYLNGQTQEEVAEGFKQQGNEAFNKGKKYYKSAENYYTKAIRQVDVPANKRSVYFSNRAAVNIELENFGRAIEDANAAIKLDPKNIKAYYRGMKASMALRKVENAVSYIDEALKIEPQNESLLKEKKKLDEIHYEKKQDDMDKKVDEFGNNRSKKAVWNLMNMKKAKLGEDLFENLTLMTRGSKVAVDKKNVIHWPVILLYEEYKQLDLIQDFADDTTFADHLEMVFPGGKQWAEWDIHHTYDHTQVEVWTVLNHVEPKDKTKRTGKMPRKIQLDKNSKLGDIISHPEYIIPGVPVFWIVPPQYKKDFMLLNIETMPSGY